jgi:sporulation protein YtfJ
MMEVSMQKIKEMIDANTIVGEPISTPDGITLIPVSKVTLGFAGGGTDFEHGKTPHSSKSSFGGGTGAGINIIPVAFLVIKSGKVDMIYITPPKSTTVDRILDAVPDVLETIGEFMDRGHEETEE